MLNVTKWNRGWARFTAQEVQMLVDNTPPEKYLHGAYNGEGSHLPPHSDTLTGRAFSLKFDGLTVNYRFTAADRLTWDEGDGSHDDLCEVFELVPDVFFVNHFVTGSAPPENRVVVLDLQNGLVTTIVARIDHPDNARDVRRRFLFGILDGYEDTGARHGYTDEMVGKAIYWNYVEGRQEIKHIYMAPTYYTVCAAHPDGSVPWASTNPADYVKIRDNLYLFSFLEERQAGAQCTFLMDLQHLHDVGAFFGVHLHGLECYCVGAKGRWATWYTLPYDREIEG